MLRPVLMLTAMLTVTGDPAPPREIGSAPIPMTVGAAGGRLLVDPGAPSMPLVTAELAARAGLRAGPFALRYLVGPVAVNGASAVGRIDTGPGAMRRRIGWTARPFAAGTDGVVGPGGLSDPVVRFTLRPAVAGERSHSLPMVDGGGLFGARAGLFATIDVAGSPLRVRFDLRRDESLATAGAGATLAAAFGGTLAATGRPMEIAFGIERPTRMMALRRAVAVGPLSLDRIAVRTADFGNADGIAVEGAVVDPDEVVVTARSLRDRSRDLLTVGRAALSRCSSLTFDKPARQIRLSCA